MLFIDTHTHLYDEAYGDSEGQDAAVRRAIEAGVGKMVIPDVNSRERKAIMDLCRRWPANCWPCMGLHPTDVDGSWQTELDMLDGALYDEMHGTVADRNRIVAIGETGLDYHYGADSMREQQSVFRAQIEMAAKYDLPLVIHSREATKDTLDILAEYRHKGIKGVFHAYSGSLETFRELDRLGLWYIGIGGVLTFKKAAIAEFVKDIPMERILLETDSPYLTPVPHRGERNESSYIPLIAQFLAQKKNASLEEVADISSRNAESLFKL